MTCVEWQNCARDGGGAEGSVEPGKVGLVHPRDVPVVRHPEILSYHVTPSTFFHRIISIGLAETSQKS